MVADPYAVHGKWTIGRVMSICLGSDAKIRNVTVKTHILVNIKDLLPKLLLSIQQKAMKNEDSVSLGEECFDILTPVLLFPAIYDHVICSLWFLCTCAER